MNLPGPSEITRQQLANGLTVLTLRRPDLPFAAMSLEVQAGSALDTVTTAGLASLTAAALTRGTAHRSARQLFIETDGLGMDLSSGSGSDGASVDVRSLLEDLPQALTILAEVLREPAFAPEEVGKLHGQTLARLQEAEDNTDYVVERAAQLRIFPSGHPYRLPSAGWPQTVAPLTAADLAAFHHRTYGPKGAILAVVGDIDPDNLLPAIEAALGDWQLGPGEAPVTAEQVAGATVSADAGATGRAFAEAAVPGADGIIRIALAGKSQSEIALGGVGPARTEPDYEALSVANLIFGRLGLGGRIGANIRERQGMAYSAYSTVAAYQQAGMWMVRAGVAPANVNRTVAAIRAELDQFLQEQVTDKELADAKGFLLGSLPMRLEMSSGMVGLLLAMERYQLGLDYMQRYPDMIGGLTAADLLSAVQRHLEPKTAVVVVAGPADQSAAG